MNEGLNKEVLGDFLFRGFVCTKYHIRNIDNRMNCFQQIILLKNNYNQSLAI